MPRAFDYDNRNPRRPTIGGRLLRVVPGVRSVMGQVKPYAEWWREQNLQTLASNSGPLWVVLGDSLSQGVGASSVERGWVPLVTKELHSRGVPVRVLNLSFSGARTAEVTGLQLSTLREAGVTPDVVTVMIGSNDLVRRPLRDALPERYRELLAVLPEGTLFATWPGGALSALAGMVNEHPGIVSVPARFSGGVAADRYHPDDRGYANVAAAFEVPLLTALSQRV